MARFQPRRVDWDIRELTEELSFANGEQVEAWVIWDTSFDVGVDKYGDPEPDYWCAHREIAAMRARDLNDHERELAESES